VAARKKKDTAGWARFILTMILLLMIMTGTLAGLYFYVQYILEQNEREGFTEEDLRIPLYEKSPLEEEDRPLFIRPGAVPPFSCRLLWPINGTSEKLDAIPGIGSVLNLSLKNEGSSRVYVEKVYYETGWNHNGSGDVNKYVEPGHQRYLRHILMPIPEPAPDPSMLTYKLYMDILVEGPSSWVRKTGIDFEESDLHLIPLSAGKTSPEYVSNRPFYYDKVNDLIEKDIEGLEKIVNDTGLNDGRFTIQDIADAFEMVISSVEYRSDPDTGSNEWISPLTCLARGGGDCEDYSMLFGAIITIMGGNARVIITSHHAFNAVYIGKDPSLLDLIDERYGLDIPFQLMEDDLGIWLVVEPQSYLVFGWFPSDVVVQKVNSSQGSISTYIYGNNVLEWVYEDSDEVSVVDIYI
jgi:transglutaminase-like putative cysteine protease